MCFCDLIYWVRRVLGSILQQTLSPVEVSVQFEVLVEGSCLVNQVKHLSSNLLAIERILVLFDDLFELVDWLVQDVLELLRQKELLLVPWLASFRIPNPRDCLLLLKLLSSLIKMLGIDDRCNPVRRVDLSTLLTPHRVQKAHLLLR